MTGAITVILADDHPLYREGVARTLNEEPDIEVVAETASADSVVEAVGRLQPGVALVDLSMPGGGLSALARIAEAFPDVRLVALTASEDSDDVMAALDLGVAGYVLKGVGGRELAAIVRQVAGGGSYVAPSLAARLLSSLRHGGAQDTPKGRLGALTRREEEILRLVAKGCSNKEVARELDLQEKTVKHYMTIIMQKMDVRNRVEAAVLANSLWSDGG